MGARRRTAGSKSPLVCVPDTIKFLTLEPLKAKNVEQWELSIWLLFCERVFNLQHWKPFFLFLHPHPHFKQYLQENTASESVVVKLRFKLFNLVEVSSLKVLSLLPSMHLDAALFRAVSSSVCYLRVPCGSNKNIPIISRSPYWHSLTTVASRVQPSSCLIPGQFHLWMICTGQTELSIFMQGSKTVFRFMKWSDDHMRRSLKERSLIWTWEWGLWLVVTSDETGTGRRCWSCQIQNRAWKKTTNFRLINNT